MEGRACSILDSRMAGARRQARTRERGNDAPAIAPACHPARSSTTTGDDQKQQFGRFQQLVSHNDGQVVGEI
jgi:hypothetical protein